MSWPRIGFRVRASLQSGDRWHVASSELANLVRSVAGAGAGAFFVDSQTPQSLEAFERERASVDPFVTLAALADADAGIGLGCLAVSIEDRPPSMLAKVVTGLDLASGGRALLAVEPGEDAQSDERFGEAVEVIRAMLRLPEPSLHGRHFQITKAWNEPRSTRDQPIPLGVLVGERLTGSRIVDTLGVAARLADFAVVSLALSHAAISPDVPTTFALASARAGRLPASVGLLLLVGIDDDADLANFARRLERARSAGFSGVVIDWRADSLAVEDAVGAVLLARSEFA